MASLLNRVRGRLFGTPDFQPADITDELRGAGTAFATLIEGIGSAVAKTSQELNQTAGDITTEMAELKIKTVQAVVSAYGDTGNLENVSVVAGETSALSIAVPPALSFQNVNVQARFTASEFSATSTANVNVNLVGASIGSRGFGMRGPSAGASVTNANTDLQTAQTGDASVGTMSMTARIRPKPVRQLAKPPLILKGPRITPTLHAFLPAQVIHPAPTQATDPPYLERRRAVVRITVTNGGNVPATVHPIAIDGGLLDWEVTDEFGAGVSTGPIPDSSSGIFHITVARNATSVGEAKKDFVLRFVMNLVNAVLHVSL